MSTTRITPTDRLRAVIDELASNQLELNAPGASLIVQLYGDALRAGITVPKAFRKQLHAVDLAAVRAIAEEAERDVESPPVVVDISDDPAAELTLRTRDQLQSVLVGLRRMALAHGLASDEFDPIYALAQALDRFDAGASKTLSRNLVERLLADRMVFQGDDGWLDRYQHHDADVGRIDVPTEVTGFHPTEVQLTNWATRGVGARIIERWSTLYDNASALEALVDALADSGVSLSLNALRWRRARRALETVEFDARPVTALAAAAHEPRDATQPMRTVELGQIGTMPAVARLVLTATSTSLRVRSEIGATTSVQFGTEIARDVEQKGTFTITVEAPHGPLELVVTGANGEVFRCTIVIGPLREAHSKAGFEG